MYHSATGTICTINCYCCYRWEWENTSMILTMNYCILLQKLVKFIYSCAITLQYALMYIRRIKRFPAKTFTNVGMVQRVIKNRVCAPTHHTGNKSPDTRRGSLASLAIHNPCRSRFIAFKRLCIHCTQVNILRLQVTLKPLSPSLHLATCVVKVACMSSYALKQRWCTQICK